MSFTRWTLAIAFIFFIATGAQSQGGDIVTTDPAIAEIEAALNLPRLAPSSTAMRQSSDEAINEMAYFMDLALSQSGGVAFDRGNITFGGTSQWATASGFIQGSSLRLDVVPASGDALYALDLELSTPPLTGTYSIFSLAAPQSGTLRASKLS